MKQESQPKILYSRALQGSMSKTTTSSSATTTTNNTMSSGNQQQLKSTTTTTSSSKMSIPVNSMVNMNGPNVSSSSSSSFHPSQLNHLNNKVQQMGTTSVGGDGVISGNNVVVGIGGNGRTILPNSPQQQTNMPFRMYNKNCQSQQQSSVNNNYSIRHSQVLFTNHRKK